jgi:two-component system chemotaxis sensor kinase CheA
MDVVRENVLRVQGQISLETTPGSGTLVTISLPLTLSTTKCLVVEASGQAFAVPISSVERILRITHEDVFEIEGESAILVGAAPVALGRLSTVLGLQSRDRDDEEAKMPVVVLHASGERVGLLVDSLVDEQEMVIKPLGKQMSRVRNLTGGTILGSGEVMLVLNPADILGASAEARLEFPELGDPTSLRPAARPRVVLAEDSITTRTMEKSILEAAGYEVIPCGDGLEAYSALATEGCDALVTDVNMPGMDGIELIERVRAMEGFAGLPILLVSSLGSEEDRRRGMQAGADAYIVKKDFEQGRFLEVLRELL